jgi:hypothetical protein
MKAAIKSKNVHGNQQMQEVAEHRIADTYRYVLPEGVTMKVVEGLAMTSRA